MHAIRHRGCSSELRASWPSGCLLTCHPAPCHSFVCRPAAAVAVGAARRPCHRPRHAGGAHAAGHQADAGALWLAMAPKSAACSGAPSAAAGLGAARRQLPQHAALAVCKAPIARHRLSPHPYFPPPVPLHCRMRVTSAQGRRRTRRSGATLRWRSATTPTSPRPSGEQVAAFSSV